MTVTPPMTTDKREPRPDEPMTLAHAADYFKFTVLTLRAEADRDRLTIYKIGRQYYTTPADIAEMVRKCRVEQKARGSISTRNAGNGSSATDRTSVALDALKQTINGHKSSSRNTSRANTSQSRRQSQSLRTS